MISKIVYFDTEENSLNGVQRGLVAFVIILLLNLIWYKVLAKNFYNKYTQKTESIDTIFGTIVIAFLLCSAIGVQLPNTAKEAIVYGILVGLVIYGCHNCFNIMYIKKWDYKILLLDTIYGTFLCGLVAYVIFKLFR